jgi:UDP-2,3-diacylglucosamine hydrolase
MTVETQTQPPVPEDTHSVVYFVSDIHLGGSSPSEEATKRERFEALLDRVASENGALYILGDLFDFWFEYRTVMPRTAFGILARIDSLARTGTPVHYLGGNHDFWMTDFLARETAIQVLQDGTTLRAQNRTARLFHGDGLGPGDTGYKVLKKILRNRMAISLFRWIHPDLGIPFALRSSGVSRNHTADRDVDVEGIYRNVALPEFRDGAEAVLMGHHHVPVHLKRDEGELLILGDWFSRYTCVRLRDGEFELLTWPLT